MKKETFKDFSIQDRKFRILKFDPWTGSWIAFSIMTNLLPFGIEKLAGISSISSSRSMMGKSDFLALEQDCLKFVHEFVITNGITSPDPIPVIMEGGTLVTEMDTVLMISLIVQVLSFNVQSFFDQLDGITSLLPPALQEKVKGLNLSDSKNPGKASA